MFWRFSFLLAQTPKAAYRGLSFRFLSSSKWFRSKTFSLKSSSGLFLNSTSIGCLSSKSDHFNLLTRQTMSSAVHSGSSNEYVVVYCTVPDVETARTISNWLVEKSLAACVNTVSGVESAYWWEGKVERDQELLLIIKTRSELVSTVANEIRTKHPYDLPEVISLPIQGGLQEYLQWIGSSTEQPKKANKT
ncbi:periplasmic divalent cation tolerance protein isoform 1 [Galdieria sulphuraria]|uniref:Periplasmic divalent cation tolerance protein isoform 1 n=1 Tax=Galdieria sulphuraria TaxID=130081 RepID=M2Y169_GALSU|nr:periplasmic divalent cation tolerance protein isoform 1 [Galdieria sulphuraria]EME29559.1 periplasmic divalent cation tolerance protein isoform 1 [Galdieria sulphuraria]|eukprot:XP_005706079.1 periplasmic divalent cation tolerance protein isoform 1 [Galdieria sulphuraria]